MQNRSPEPTLLTGVKWRGFFSFILVAVILMSLLAIVYVQHKIRSLESRYYSSMQQTLVAKEEWGRLMLEKQHLTSQATVERVAKQQLDMTLDKQFYKVIVLPPPVPVKSVSANLSSTEQLEKSTDLQTQLTPAVTIVEEQPDD